MKIADTPDKGAQRCALPYHHPLIRVHLRPSAVQKIKFIFF